MRDKTKYRIQKKRSGVDFGYQYRSSLAGAIKLASEDGWIEQETKSHDLKPEYAEISARLIERSPFYGQWELIATVDARGVHVRDWQDRNSVKVLLDEIEERKAMITQAISEHKALSELTKKPEVTERGKQ